MLLKRYGDPFTVTSGFRKKLESWSQVAPQESNGKSRQPKVLEHKMASKLPRRVGSHKIEQKGIHVEEREDLSSFF